MGESAQRARARATSSLGITSLKIIAAMLSFASVAWPVLELLRFKKIGNEATINIRSNQVASIWEISLAMPFLVIPSPLMSQGAQKKRPGSPCWCHQFQLSILHSFLAPSVPAKWRKPSQNEERNLQNGKVAIAILDCWRRLGTSDSFAACLPSGPKLQMFALKVITW